MSNLVIHVLGKLLLINQYNELPNCVQWGGQVEIIANNQGHWITMPSWVSFTDDK
jgi:hypothetical protein